MMNGQLANNKKKYSKYEKKNLNKVLYAPRAKEYIKSLIVVLFYLTI